MTAGEWRGLAPPEDTTPPTLEVHGTGTADGAVAAEADERVTFSPNGDGKADRLVIDRRLSEPAYVDVEVRNGADEVIRSYTRFGEKGLGETTWDGRNDADEVVNDGVFRLRLTPRDRAGNVGDPTGIDVRVLTTMRLPTVTASAIHVADGDGLADGTLVRTTLKREARVTIEVKRSGATVRTPFADDQRPTGALSWRWDGRNNKGAPVPSGSYKVWVSATTDDGTLRYAVPVFVGPYRFAVSDRTPARGRDLKVVVRSTEALDRAPRLVVDQPGFAQKTLRMKLIDPKRASLTFRVRAGGPKGTLRLAVNGVDVGGQAHSGDLSLPLR
jgi:flagellar hook assembly protein FlgD